MKNFLWLIVVVLTVMASTHAQSISSERISKLTWSPDGSKIAVGYTNGSILILDAIAGQTLQTLLGHDDIVFILNWRSDGQQLISGSWDNTASDILRES